MWVHIAAFKFPFIGTSLRTSFHYPVVWNTSQLLLFLSLLCSSAKQTFSSDLFLIIMPCKSTFAESISFGWCKRYVYVHVPVFIEQLLITLIGKQATNQFTCTTGGSDWTKERMFRFLNVSKFNTHWKFYFWCYFMSLAMGKK